MHGYLLQPTSNVQGFRVVYIWNADVTMIDIRYIIGVIRPVTGMNTLSLPYLKICS